MPLAQSIAEECVDYAQFFGINPHFMLASGQIRSGLADVNGNGKFGPFQIPQKDWDAGRQDPEYASFFNFLPTDISSWRCTCDIFALMTFHSQNAQLAQLGRYPSAVELYQAQWPDDAPLRPGEMNAALQATAELVGPAVATLNDPTQSQGVVDDPDASIVPIPPPQQPSPSSFGTGAFQDKAPRIMRSLISDFQLTSAQAAGVLGNLGHETGGFRFFHEIGKPMNQGGIGWAQWTGSRRRAFERFCQDKNFTVTSDQANYAFLKEELTSSEHRSLLDLRQQHTISDAVQSFLDKFERAGVPAGASRVSFAKIAINAFNSASAKV